MADDVSAGLSASKGRRFGFTVGAAFLVLGLFSLWRGHPITMRVFAGLGGALVIGGAVVPRALLPVERGWMSLAHVLSKVTTPLVMGVLYFGIITPVGVVRRMFGRRAMVRHPHGHSAWVARADNARRSDLTHQF